MKVLIAGASGLVGSALIAALEAEGSEVTRLVRTSAGAGEIEWHPNNDQIDAATLEGFDAIINFAGENIAGRVRDRQEALQLEAIAKQMDRSLRALAERFAAE